MKSSFKRVVMISVFAVSTSLFAYSLSNTDKQNDKQNDKHNHTTMLEGRRCTGKKNCKACTTCNYCKHCKKNKGTCGVCS